MTDISNNSYIIAAPSDFSDVAEDIKNSADSFSCVSLSSTGCKDEKTTICANFNLQNSFKQTNACLRLLKLRLNYLGDDIITFVNGIEEADDTSADEIRKIGG